MFTPETAHKEKDKISFFGLLCLTRADRPKMLPKI